MCIKIAFIPKYMPCSANNGPSIRLEPITGRRRRRRIEIHYVGKCDQSVYENREEDPDAEKWRIVYCAFLPLYTECVLGSSRLAFARLYVRVFVNLFCANIHRPTNFMILPRTTTRDPSRVIASAKDSYVYHLKTINGPVAGGPESIDNLVG